MKKLVICNTTRPCDTFIMRNGQIVYIHYKRIL